MMKKIAYFVSHRGDGWPKQQWLARYFLTPEGRRDFFSGGNDSWGLTAEGVDGTENLPIHKGRLDVDLTIQGHPDLGVQLQYRKTGRVPIEIYYAKGDLSRLHQWVKSAHGDLQPIGLFVPFETAWMAIKEFMDRDAALPTCIPWVADNQLPPDAFPPP